MPLYELLCLAKPALARSDLSGLMRRLGESVFKSGGVITDIKSFGQQRLAYDIRRPFQKYDQAHMWQMDFVVSPTALRSINHELRVDEKVLRYVIVKRPLLSKQAEREGLQLAQQEVASKLELEQLR